ncbi:MAG: hypothetical protein RL514_4464 [Verrucomicrobiota bacterium]
MKCPEAIASFRPVLDDREYMRQPSFRTSLTVTQKLMIVLGVVFALQCINVVYLKTSAEPYLALTTDGLKSGFVWQLFTFQFLHGGLFHLLMNLLGLWFLGSWVERVLGTKRYLFFFALCGLGGGLLQGALMLLFPGHYGSLLYGASAGTSGMLALFAVLESESEIRWNFVIPIRAKHLLWLEVGISLFFTVVPVDRGVAHAAHLGGILAGLAFARLGWHHDYVALPWEKWFARKPGKTSRVSSLAGFDVRSANKEEEPLSDDFISKEVDPILDKISAHGIHSLTDRERKILEKARAVMAKRS